jgi:hypothetical protein
VTALHKAVMSSEPQSVEITTLLLARGASATAVDSVGMTVLYSFARGMFSDITMAKQLLDLLLQHGAKALLDTPSTGEHNPILAALCWHNHNALQAFIEAGARTDVESSDGGNILHYAALCGTREVLECLHDARITDIDIRTPNGYELTPLGEMRRRSDHVKSIESLYGPFKPTLEIIRAFERLLWTVRDRAILDEVKKLDDIIGLLHKGQTILARDELQAICSQKTKASIKAEAETFRAIVLQVKLDMIEPAVESLTEFIQVSKARMDKSPYGEYDADPCYHFKHNPPDLEAEKAELSTLSDEAGVNHDS